MISAVVDTSAGTDVGALAGRTNWKHLKVANAAPPVPWLLAASSPGIKRPEREADQSPSFIAGVGNDCSYTSTPPYAYMVCVCVCVCEQLYTVFV